jgi:hypothetical protein
MLGAKSGSYLGGTNSSGWVCLQRIERGAYLSVQPVFDGTITSLQRTQAIAYDFAFRSVFASFHFGLHCVCHVSGQGNAELLSGSHGGLQS